MGTTNSSGSGLRLISILTEERRRKRMESNRESARRSRMRKQRHLDDMMSQVTKLRRGNSQILTTMTVTTQHLIRVEADNSVLRAQICELTHRLNSLNEIIGAGSVVGGFEAGNGLGNLDPWINNNMGLMCFNQPIMASSDQFY